MRVLGTPLPRDPRCTSTIKKARQKAGFLGEQELLGSVVSDGLHRTAFHGFLAG